MKWIIVAMFLFYSCSNPDTNLDSGLLKYIDDGNEVTCYRVQHFEGLSCVPNK